MIGGAGVFSKISGAGVRVSAGVVSGVCLLAAGTAAASAGTSNGAPNGPKAATFLCTGKQQTYEVPGKVSAL